MIRVKFRSIETRRVNPLEYELERQVRYSRVPRQNNEGQTDRILLYSD